MIIIINSQQNKKPPVQTYLHKGLFSGYEGIVIRDFLKSIKNKPPSDNLKTNPNPKTNSQRPPSHPRHRLFLLNLL